MRVLDAIAERRSAVILASGALLLDQVSKDLAVTLLNGEAPVMAGPFALTYARNPGAALGSFGGLPEALRLPVVLSLSLVALLVVLPFIAIQTHAGPGRAAGVSLVLSGALGNLLDRVRHGFVIDFITLNPAITSRFPVFNLADVAVISGALLLLLFMRR